jgi:hypothetical protein
MMYQYKLVMALINTFGTPYQGKGIYPEAPCILETQSKGVLLINKTKYGWLGPILYCVWKLYFVCHDQLLSVSKMQVQVHVQEQEQVQIQLQVQTNPCKSIQISAKYEKGQKWVSMPNLIFVPTFYFNSS